MGHLLKVGLEIHTQLQTARKLFSLSHNSTSNLFVKPNTQVSFFDVSLPGSQPKLNPEVIMLALKAAMALSCKVNAVSKFDRKHYFYGDQPLGYQITQRYQPIAKDGLVTLTKKYDGLSKDRPIRIEQIQIEQDTGRSLYKLDSGTQVDFNRSNIPLIEMVTKPDFDDIEQVRAFIKKYARMLQNIHVCTGELETGAIRVDVNVSIDDHQRIELKNIPTTSAIVSAIRHEYKRQCDIVDDGGSITEVETRGWDGKRTYKLRSKEDSIDYRYMPDPELPVIKLDVDDILTKIQKTLPPTIEERTDELMKNYKLKLRDANMLLSNPQLLDYYLQLYEACRAEGLRNPINWLVHDFVGDLSKSELAFDRDILPVDKFVEVLKLLREKVLTKANAKLLLMHLVNNRGDQNTPLLQLVNDLDMNSKASSNIDVNALCEEVITSNPRVVEDIAKGKVQKVNYLIGQCMRASRGQLEPSTIEAALKERLGLNGE